MTERELAAFVARFEARQVAKAEWTHQAHLLVGLWYLSRHPHDEALAIVRRRIREHNDAVGTPNSDTEGYHETITRLYLLGIDAFVRAREGVPLEALIDALLASPMGDRAWPLTSYSRERLFSVEARRGWVPPDRGP